MPAEPIPTPVPAPTPPAESLSGSASAKSSSGSGSGSAKRMPLAVYILDLSVFALGTSEFMLTGLLPAIADDMSVSIPQAGLLISAFAIGMVVGAPLLAVATLRLPRRTTLIALITVFGLGQVAGALAPNYALLFASRVVSALACAGFWAVGAAVAIAMVPVNARARAMAVMIGGLSIANVLGVPLGALLGDGFGWRAAFWAVALISLPALIGILRSVPSRTTGPATPGRISIRPQLAVLLLLGALVNGATFCSFTYLSPILTEVTGLGAGWVPAMLALFGLGSFAGVTVAGRYADRRDRRLAFVAGGILLLGWIGFALTSAYVVPSVVLVLVQGALSFAVGSTLIAYALYAGSQYPVLTGGLATAALNVGAAAGPVLGGVAIGVSGFSGPLWVSAGLVATALLVAGSIKLVGREGPG